MKESTLKVVLPLGTLALVGAAIYWFSAPQSGRDTGPPPPIASVLPPELGGAPGSWADATEKSLSRRSASQTTTLAPKQSSFNAAEMRNPFWPIGWSARDLEKSEAEAGPALSSASFALTSVTVGPMGRFAILNRKSMQEGQRFGLQMGQRVHQITVRKILDGRVILAYEGGEILVRLRRK